MAELWVEVGQIKKILLFQFTFLLLILRDIGTVPFHIQTSCTRSILMRTLFSPAIHFYRSNQELNPDVMRWIPTCYPLHQSGYDKNLLSSITLSNLNLVILNGNFKYFLERNFKRKQWIEPSFLVILIYRQRLYPLHHGLVYSIQICIILLPFETW